VIYAAYGAAMLFAFIILARAATAKENLQRLPYESTLPEEIKP
jgi:hypothetical protein